MKRYWLINMRNKREFSQETVAKMVGISRSYYSQIETGERNPSGTIALRIADFFETDVSKFFSTEVRNMRNYEELELRN